ncbi:hypothetical protein [Streptomyces sp. AK02-04a]|uniref:hypothetical protein n=1 Tax=Streptomyces sp. AK02-04a TaxID=3028649 RepID=UPI0029BE7845|nr:hypothetical protein [Streptomyces sp. AK02-04a]MDX3762606.1 hypothetical protein [Streptomyces sp. AK02-04a]
MLLEPSLSEQDKAVCLAYWAFTEPGSWTHKVAEIGSSNQVLRTVKEASRAALLTCVCPECGGPTTVATRSEMAALGLWHADRFPFEEVASSSSCAECREAAAALELQEQQRAHDEEQKAAQERVQAASAWVAEHSNHPFPDEFPTVPDALALLTMIDIMERTERDTFGPINTGKYTLGLSHSADIETLCRLHGQRWLAPALPATISNFAFNEDNTVRGVYVDQVPWRLAHALGDDTPRARQQAAETATHLLLRRPSRLRDTVMELEATTALAYLDGLLDRSYDEPPVPEHRRQEAYETFHEALINGFNLRQLVAVAWMAASSSVAWGQRTPGLKPGSVSAACVTNVDRRIGVAHDRPVPEYDLPNWVSLPATHATAQRLLKQHEAVAGVLNQFRSLRQSITARDVEELEHGDGGMAHLDPSWGESAVVFALITPDGQLSFQSKVPSAMRDTISCEGAAVDRVILHEPRTIHAYVGELLTPTPENDNPVANETLRLLDCYDGPFRGTVAFFSVSARSNLPQSLDSQQQELLTLAHQIAQSRTQLSTSHV